VYPKCRVVVKYTIAFWFEKQIKRLGIVGNLPASSIFVSYERGKRKKSIPYGTYRILSATTDPATTLVLDDRYANLEIADREGFKTLQYNGTAETRIADELAFI
jgi:hypothetical protein